MKEKRNALVELIGEMSEEQFQWFIDQVLQGQSCTNDQPIRQEES